MNIFDPLSIPLGKLMHFIYYTITFENYGFALILFTILTRLLMLPLTIKQYQGSAKMQRLNPRLEELRRQYGTDKKRLQEETMKLYQEEKVNPAGGCLPLLIQFPILFSLYPVITRPLRYMLGKTVEQVSAIQELFNTITGNARSFVQEMEIINFFKNNTSAMSQAESANLLVPSDLINMNFAGLDLSRTPTYAPNMLFGDQMSIYLPLLLIPIIGVVSTYISGKISMASTAAQSTQNQQASSMSKSMQIFGPVMTLIFSFQLPAGVLVYWIAGYLIQIVQQLFINKYVLKLDNIFSGKGAGGAAAQQQLQGKKGPNGQGQGLQGQLQGQQGQLLQGQQQRQLPDKGGRAGGHAGSGSGGSGSGSGGGYGSGGGGSGGGNLGDTRNSAVGGMESFGTSNAQFDAAGNAIGSIARGKALTGDGIKELENDELYDGGAMINKVISSLDIAGATGGGAVKAAGTGGLVHGGVFETKIRIPGITGTDDYIDEDEIDKANIYIHNPSTTEANYPGPNNLSFDSKAGKSVSENEKENEHENVNTNIKNINNNNDNNLYGSGQRARSADSRSSTRKNYGSQKRKKKK